MQTERLVVMANQIGDFYKSSPDLEQSKKDIAQHLKKFWAKSMCDQIIGHVNESGAEDLYPLVRAAVSEHLAK